MWYVEVYLAVDRDLFVLGVHGDEKEVMRFQVPQISLTFFRSIFIGNMFKSIKELSQLIE